jgi:hypothetical protein
VTEGGDLRSGLPHNGSGQMSNPGRHTTIPRKRTAGFHRLARLLSLVAMLLNQPLAAIHAATDEDHLSHGTPHTVHLAEGTHEGSGHQHGAPPHPESLHHQTCQVCPLVGAALQPPGLAKITNPSGWHHLDGPAVIQASKPEKRLRVGGPVRAPPRNQLI